MTARSVTLAELLVVNGTSQTSLSSITPSANWLPTGTCEFWVGAS